MAGWHGPGSVTLDWVDDEALIALRPREFGATRREATSYLGRDAVSARYRYAAIWDALRLLRTI